MKSYEEWIQEPAQLPWTLLGKWGRRFFGAFAKLADVARDDIYEAVVSRFVSRAPSDALPYGAQDTNVPTFLTFDTEGEIRARIADPWGWHERQGTEPGIDETLEILGFDPDQTWVLDASKGEHWLHEGGWWSSWCVVAKNPTGWGLRTETWDEMEAYGRTWDEWDALEGTWDYTAPASLFSQLYEFLWTRKWTHGVPVYVAVTFGDGYSWDELQARGLSWDEIEALWLTWDELGDAEAHVVVQTARLWDAMNLVGGGADITWDELEAMGLRWDRCLTAT